MLPDGSPQTKANVSAQEFRSGTDKMNQPSSPAPVRAPCQACWIGFRVVDEAGKEVTGIHLCMEQDSKDVSSGTDEHGKLRRDGIPQPAYSLNSMTGPRLFRFVEVKESPPEPKPAAPAKPKS